MKAKRSKLIWVNIHQKNNGITPVYYFDFDKLNELGLPDTEIFDFIKEMKTMAEKEIEERLNQKGDGKK